MPFRNLTEGEKTLLRPIFAETLPYASQQVSINEAGWGGPRNSMTPGIVPLMAKSIWATDYSAGSVPDSDRWVFIHEMAHVWHWHHGGSNIRSAIWTWIAEDDYEDAYDYDLADESRLKDFNFEAQAAIVADYWYVKKGLTPLHNKGARKDLNAYNPFIVQLQATGSPPRDHRNPDKEIGFKV